MNMTRTFFVCTLLVFATHAQEAPEGLKNLITPDLANFETEGNWMVTDGVVTLHPRDGESGWKRYGSYLWLKKEYKDFVCDFEFMYPPKGNSGFYFRCKDKIDPTKRGIEVQLLDSFGKEQIGPHDMGGVIRASAPSKNMSKPAGEWNRMIVKCVGPKLTVELNGKQIQDVDLSASKVKDRPAQGWIGFQDHGQAFSLRNIRFKEL